ncbi:hypothetical protein E1B28_005418 [Marasmius oreades]|uniref:Uncharacterized protein n=1 Tax=Marasmius oreades TaxID=181124 RepID=A0A9P7UUJ4_9AGAR|nr:uncharacterized protein E1B28_005418 [Marasmius oreades]KAG7094593.1 hypothetical protein E1B28_005418 [Marasmius oreades]
MFIIAVALASLLSVSAVDRNTVAEQSAIQDPVKQCEIYNFPPIENEIPKFPEVFKQAKILPNDAAARAKFDEILKNIPKIAPKVVMSSSILVWFGLILASTYGQMRALSPTTSTRTLIVGGRRRSALKLKRRAFLRTSTWYPSLKLWDTVLTMAPTVHTMRFTTI